jgi:hypothetical protein
MPGIRTRRFALTLADLIFAASAVLVVTLVVGPALTKPRATARLTDCLSNLQRIGMALHAYAAEDPREQAIPLQMDMVADPTYLGPVGADNGYWLWRTANWYAWGGQSATLVFKTSSSSPAGYAFSDAPPQDGNSIPYIQRPDYAAAHRPLNGYIAPDLLDVFHCPADAGYPSSLNDMPTANLNRPCWDTLGDSYQASLAQYVKSYASEPYAGALSFGAWGHRLSTLPNPGRMILIRDGLWSHLLGADPNGPPNPPPVGWHGVAGSDNVLFCDGSARLTSALGADFSRGRRPLSADGLKLDQPPICDATGICGPTWQVDCYPTPGAVVFGDWSVEIQVHNCWPYRHAQMNPFTNAPADAPPPSPSPVQVLW